MKYEPVFGDQSLFDGAPSDSTHATKGGGFYMVTEDGGVQYLSRGPLNWDMCKCIGGHLIAERRIIAEPKRWTVEDQKAGMLPEVGSKFFEGGYGEDEVIKITDNSVVSLRPGNHGAVSISKQIFFMENGSVYPIETPQEKAQREEDEFVSLVESKYNHMPDEISFRAGIRAAYRKLKGGE